MLNSVPAVPTLSDVAMIKVKNVNIINNNFALESPTCDGDQESLIPL